MPQGELSPVVNIKGENVDAYVKAFCAFTGAAEPPVGEVTAPQMKVLIRAVMNEVYRKRRRETLEVTALE